MAHRGTLGLYMALCQAHNPTYAHFQSCIAPARSFRGFGSVKNHRAVITPSKSSSHHHHTNILEKLQAQICEHEAGRNNMFVTLETVSL